MTADIILDLGRHAWADTFIPANRLHNQEPIYPLKLQLDNTGYICTVYITPAYERYNLYPYSYTSANSDFSRQHWNTFYSDVATKPYDFVVEIGCNDGYLLKQFQNKSKVLGIDASNTICQDVLGVGIINSIFTEEVAEEVIQNYGSCDLIIANNVLNHANNLLNFLKGIKRLLNDTGDFVFEVPYWKCLVDSLHFDQIYHEHVSYFTVKSLNYYLNSVGLQITNFYMVDYHGGSLRVFASKNGKTSEKVATQIKVEEDAGLFEVATYQKFQKTLDNRRDAFLAKFYKLRTLSDQPIIAVGAGAKANTFLTYYNLGNGVVDYITDSSQLKIGKYTPLTRIPIAPDSIFSEFKAPIALVLSWNISEQLRNAISKHNKNIQFLNANY